jgi:hypothetical protein
MEALRIEIINPKVKDILKGLADLKLISISNEHDDAGNMKALLKKLRSGAKNAFTVEDINEEVEYVRSQRHARKKA